MLKALEPWAVAGADVSTVDAGGAAWSEHVDKSIRTMAQSNHERRRTRWLRRGSVFMAFLIPQEAQMEARVRRPERRGARGKAPASGASLRRPAPHDFQVFTSRSQRDITPREA